MKTFILLLLFPALVCAENTCTFAKPNGLIESSVTGGKIDGIVYASAIWDIQSKTLNTRFVTYTSGCASKSGKIVVEEDGKSASFVWSIDGTRVYDEMAIYSCLCYFLKNPSTTK